MDNESLMPYELPHSGQHAFAQGNMFGSLCVLQGHCAKFSTDIHHSALLACSNKHMLLCHLTMGGA